MFVAFNNVPIKVDLLEPKNFQYKKIITLYTNKNITQVKKHS